MSKELFVSSTPHETKVAVVEEDQLAEIYFERENEYTLAGSIYKGKVTRLLPGMQSAFVDIGLERDAFLYVSDFTEFMEEEEEIDFREVGDEHRPPPRVDDRSRRGERPRPEPASHSARPAAPPVEEHPAERPVRFGDAIEQVAEIDDQSVIPPPPSEEEIQAAGY